MLATKVWLGLEAIIDPPKPHHCYIRIAHQVLPNTINAVIHVGWSPRLNVVVNILFGMSTLDAKQFGLLGCTLTL